MSGLKKSTVESKAPAFTPARCRSFVSDTPMRHRSSALCGNTAKGLLMFMAP